MSIVIVIANLMGVGIPACLAAWHPQRSVKVFAVGFAVLVSIGITVGHALFLDHESSARYEHALRGTLLRLQERSSDNDVLRSDIDRLLQGIERGASADADTLTTLRNYADAEH